VKEKAWLFQLTNEHSDYWEKLYSYAKCLVMTTTLLSAKINNNLQGRTTDWPNYILGILVSCHNKNTCKSVIFEA
jgi:hypothetical protein